MFTQVLEQVARILQFVVDLVFDIFDSLGATSFVFGAFSVVLVYRLLLGPVLGSRADFTRRDMTVDKVDEIELPYLSGGDTTHIGSSSEYMIENK